MGGTSGILVQPSAEARRRLTVRYFAAAVAGVTAFLYFLIGLGIASVVDVTPAEDPFLFYFGVSAGLAFAFGALLLIAFDRRILWVLGALFQVAVIFMYLGVADQRTPPFETWGILIKVAQIALLGALVYLAVRPRAPAMRTRDAS